MHIVRIIVSILSHRLMFLELSRGKHFLGEGLSLVIYIIELHIV